MTTVRLLVGPKTPQDRIDHHVQRLLEQIHATRNITEVDIVVWDDKTQFGQYANKSTRLYADPDIYAMLESQGNRNALAEWGRTWKIATRSQKGSPPLYVFSGGRKGILTPDQSVDRASWQQDMSRNDPS